MDQLYFDGMTICNHVGFPDLLLTFMCNLHWPKIQRFLRPKNLHAQDQSDIVSRIFKIKFDQLWLSLFFGQKPNIWKSSCKWVKFIMLDKLWLSLFFITWYILLTFTLCLQIYTHLSSRKEVWLMLTFCYSYILQASI